MASNARNLSKLLGTSTQVPTTALPPAIADLETIGQTLSGGEIAPSSIKSNTLTQSFDSNQAVTFNMADSIDAVSPIVSVFKEVPMTGVTSKGQWDVNANATNYEFFDEKTISYSSATLTPSATGDGTFTNSAAVTSGYDLSNISYDNKSFDVSTQETKPTGLHFKPDGSKMYVSGYGTDAAYQYSLSTPYDVSTASYDSKSLSGLSQDTTNGRGLDFKPDGTKLYFIGGTNDRVYEYSLSTAWDISTGSYNNVFFGVGSQANNPSGVRFKSDGTKMYVSQYQGNSVGNYVYQYTLSTAWDITSASYDNVYLDVNTQPVAVEDFAFSSDGTSLVVCDSAGVLRKYTLSTGWDISTASLITTTASLTQLSNGSGAVAFNADGTKTYVASRESDTVCQYSTSGSLAFNTADVGKKVVGNSGSAIITATSGTYTSVTPFADTSAISSWQLFSAEGKSDGSGIQLNGYSLPHTNVSTPTHTKTYTWPTSYAKLGNIKISPDGTSFYATHYNSTSGLVHRFSLSSPYDISSATFTESLSFNLIRDILWNSDGTKLYGLGNAANNGIFTKVASTPYSLANMTNGTTVTSTFTTDTGGNTLMKGFCFSTDKTQLYIANHGTNYIYQYSLDGDPGEIDSGLTYVGAVATGINNPHTIEMQADGLKIWFTCYLEGASSRYHYLPLSTAFDITSAGSRVQQYFPSPANSVGGNSRTPIFTFNEKQTIMYVSSTGNADSTDNIFQFDIGTISLPYSTYSPALTNSSNGQINSSSWVDINSMTADETKNGGDVFYAVSTDNRTSWGVAKASDGVRKIARNNSGTWQYNNDAGTSTTVNLGFSLASPSYDNKSYSVSHSNPRGMYLKPDGTELYIGAYTGHVYQFTLSTPNDISTASSTGNYNIDEENDTVALTFKPDGTKMYAASGTNVHQYTLSTAWDITTASYDSVSYTPSDMGSSDIHSLNFNSDGTKLFMSDDGSSDNRIREYSLSTAYLLSSASTTSNYLYHAKANVRGVDFNSDGTKIFLSGVSDRKVYQYNLASPYTLSSSQGTTADAEYNVISVISGGMYSMAFSNDGAKLFILEDNTPSVKQFSTTESQNTIVYGTSETWVNGTNNNEHATLQQALTSQAFNRMNKAQLDAVADNYHFSQDSADTLDLMIAPYAASGTSPISDGVTINYDAEALIREAIPGTDYIAEFPNPNKLNITAVGAANLKIRAQ